MENSSINGWSGGTPIPGNFILDGSFSHVDEPSVARRIKAAERLRSRSLRRCSLAPGRHQQQQQPKPVSIKGKLLIHHVFINQQQLTLYWYINPIKYNQQLGVNNNNNTNSNHNHNHNVCKKKIGFVSSPPFQCQTTKYWSGVTSISWHQSPTCIHQVPPKLRKQLRELLALSQWTPQFFGSPHGFGALLRQLLWTVLTSRYKRQLGKMKAPTFWTPRESIASGNSKRQGDSTKQGPNNLGLYTDCLSGLHAFGGYIGTFQSRKPQKIDCLCLEYVKSAGSWPKFWSRPMFSQIHRSVHFLTDTPDLID